MFDQFIALAMTDDNPQTIVFRAFRNPVPVCASGAPKSRTFPESWGVTFASATSSDTSALGTGMLISANAGWAAGSRRARARSTPPSGPRRRPG